MAKQRMEDILNDRHTDRLPCKQTYRFKNNMTR